ncbi:MAG: phosphate acyltransferase PlsX [Anaerolineaceae bacterium]|nr:MAG: phosphate acyltransferase PlsX [Anaerolineaceae bacterium]
MRIVLDAMGSDTHPDPEVEAAVEAATLWEDTIVLTGPEDILQHKLDTYGISTSRIEIEHAPEVLEMTDKPAEAARGKALNSMAVGMELLKDNKADVFVTAGNTGGAMANALFRLGRIRGVKRPAVTPIIPVMGGQAVVLDVGANADCKPIYMIQFAIMGTIYAEKLLGISSPRVGLLSNGEEPGKGNMLVKETYPLLEEAGVNFIGNVEPKEVFAGEVDVVVTDGFSGNVFIKTSEAVASFMSRIIRSEITSSPISSVGGLLVRPAFKRIGTMLDPSEHGAAILLGVDGLVFIGHGRSDAKALVSAIRVAREAVLSGLLEATREAIRTRLAETPQKETT